MSYFKDGYKLMDFCTEDKFLIQGLEDNCYMLVDDIEFVAMNIPLFFRGEMFQIDNETGEAHSLGLHELQVSIEIDAYWSADEKGGRQ